MSAGLHLTITTPSAVLVDVADAQSVRAEDDSGGFGILPGHADFLTVLPASVIRWRDDAGHLHYCAQGGGVFAVSEGNRILVACRQATLGDDLGRLENDVRAMQSALADADRKSRVEQTRLHTNAVRQLARLLRPGVAGANGPMRSRDELP